jgi:alpha/beta superfamily hydrolase
MQIFPDNEATFLLPGPAGDLEVLTAQPDTLSDENTIAIICHPHPMHGGTMQNKVVTTLARTFKDLGLRSVRFNFRGVGKSVGEFDQGEGELKDLFAIVDWVKSLFPGVSITLAGFSFGAYIAIKAATQISVKQLVCVAPPVSRFDIKSLPPMTCPWVVVQGDQDEVIDANAVFEWAETVMPKPELIRMVGAGHFFHGQLLELRRRLEEVLR